MTTAPAFRWSALIKKGVYMVVDGKLSCRYCSADITRLEPWPAGERREFACPKCGCVNYVTPVVEYRSTTFGRELWRAIKAEVLRRGETAYVESYDEDAASIRLNGTAACMYVRFDGPSSARADGLHVSVRGKQVPLDEYVGMEPNEAARVVVDRIEELGHAAEQEA